MFSLTDAKYSRYSYEEKATRIVNIQEAMEIYIKSTIYKTINNVFFQRSYSNYYFEPNVIEEILDKYSFDPRLFQPIHDVMAEVFRHQCRVGLNRPLIKEDCKRYFFWIYNDVDFLDMIDENYHFICIKWYEFVRKELMDPTIIRHLGYSAHHYVYDDDHYHHKSYDEAYLAARHYQDLHQDINWNRLYHKGNE